MIIGIVGCGGIAHAHVRALSFNRHVTGLAFYDVNEENMRELSESASLPVTYCQHLGQLAEISEGFIICTPNHLHVSLAEEVLSHKNIPFLCEKPLSTDLASAERLISASPPASVISFNYRYNRVIETIIEQRDANGLGELNYFGAEFNKNSALTRNHITWRDSAQQSKSSGALGDLSCHLLDMFCLLGGGNIDTHALRTVKGTRVRFKQDGPVEVDDNGYVFGRSERGAYFKIHASKSEEPDELGLHLHAIFDKGEIRYSTRNENSLFLKRFDCPGTEQINFSAKKQLDDPARELPYWADSFIYMHRDWCELLRNGTQSSLLAGLSTGLHIQQVIEAF